MIVFPNAKINLGLNIITRRPDGYHNIETCFYPIAFNDVIEITENDKFEFTSSGLNIEGDPEKNLVVKAYRLLRHLYVFPDVKIHLHKVIPMGAGLGGGSSDAAAVLKALAIMFDLHISKDEITELAAKLGADCAFFIENKPVMAFEKGDKFKNIHLDLSKYYIVVVHPNIHVGTAEAYAGVKPEYKPIVVDALLNLDFSAWKDNLKNDFEDSIFEKHPKLAEIKNELYNQGALYASMSGSGSALYGIFKEEISLNVFKQYTCWQGRG